MAQLTTLGHTATYRQNTERHGSQSDQPSLSVVSIARPRKVLGKNRNYFLNPDGVLKKNWKWDR